MNNPIYPFLQQALSDFLQLSVLQQFLLQSSLPFIAEHLSISQQVLPQHLPCSPLALAQHAWLDFSHFSLVWQHFSPHFSLPSMARQFLWSQQELLQQTGLPSKVTFEFPSGNGECTSLSFWQHSGKSSCALSLTAADFVSWPTLATALCSSVTFVTVLSKTTCAILVSTFTLPFLHL